MLRRAHIRGNELSVFKQITLRFFKAPPHESENFWNRRSFSVFAFSPRVNGVYRCKTGSFSKTVPRVEIFENDGFNTFTYGRTKTEVFEYHDVIHHIPLALSMLCKGCYRIVLYSVFAKTGKNDWNTLHLYMWECIFFFLRRKEFSCPELSWFVWAKL